VPTGYGFVAYGDVTIFGENELVEKRKRGWKNKVRMMRGTTKWLWPIVKHEPDVKHDPEDNVSNSFTKKINTLLINDCAFFLSFFWWVRTPVVKMKNEIPLSFAVNKGEVHTLPFHNSNRGKEGDNGRERVRACTAHCTAPVCGES
jgi:hypothetical protein